MTKTELGKLRSSLAAIEKTKNKLALVRDELRSQVNDLEDILGSTDDAIELLEDGKDNFQRAVESLSKFV